MIGLVCELFEGWDGSGDMVLILILGSSTAPKELYSHSSQPSESVDFSRFVDTRLFVQ